MATATNTPVATATSTPTVGATATRVSATLVRDANG
jgi:hypothetical protein